MLIGQRALKSLNSIEKIKPRVMAATFNSNPSTIIISCYSPTNVSDETDLIAFYNKLSFLVRSILKHNVFIIGGDIIAQIDKNANNKFRLHNLSNRNGVYLIDFTLKSRSTWFNSKFQKRKGRLWTYTYANSAKEQINFWMKRELNCDAYSSFQGMSSDHQFVTAKIRQSLRKNVAQTTTTVL